MAPDLLQSQHLTCNQFLHRFRRLCCLTTLTLNVTSASRFQPFQMISALQKGLKVKHNQLQMFRVAFLIEKKQRQTSPTMPLFMNW